MKKLNISYVDFNILISKLIFEKLQLEIVF